MKRKEYTLNKNVQNEINYYSKHISEANRLRREGFNLFIIHKIS